MTYAFRDIPVEPFTQRMFNVNSGQMVDATIESLNICVRSDNPLPHAPQIKVGPYFVYVGLGTIRQ